MLFWHAFVHHRTISVALDMSFETLQGTPCHFTNFIAGKAPIVEASEMLAKALCITVHLEVDKRVAQARRAAKINWKVEKVKGAKEALAL